MTLIRLLILPLLSLLVSCNPAPELNVKEAVVKLSPVDSNPSALYFTVKGGAQDVELIRVSSPSVIRLEMHETLTDPKTGMMTMTKIDRIKIPAAGDVAFKRGGKHVMLWGVNLIARRLEKLELEFLFSNNDRILVTAPLEKIAADDGAHAGH